MSDEKNEAAELLEDMLLVQTQVRLYHWSTKLYSRLWGNLMAEY